MDVYFLYKQCSLYFFIYRLDKDIFSYHIIARIDNKKKKLATDDMDNEHCLPKSINYIF
jgi:hypothetical protein